MPLTAESLTRFAGLLADRSRAAMCLALLDGRAWTAGELARHADVVPSTASEHLTALVTAGVLAEQRQGRHRYLRLAGPEIATVLEDLGSLVGERARPTSLRTARADDRLAAARTCYDHLAGAWGVAVFDALVAKGFLTGPGGQGVTPAGRAWFAEVCPGSVETASRSRPLVRECLDWTGRRSHLGGRLGAALLERALASAWVVAVPGFPRALTVTSTGREAFADLLCVDLVPG
ncbi:helix-turn-helix transcriptional regulator [Blastococcus sp. URHD0036]|uniref:ArsR/SmtB family transcription factor n=1 Tax=Blastococcus sp. URHD0036 TaxID=1380356 RepID=UPI000495C3A6|nr:winged helix-turn-helix domain-containing protein [Blastococcus sp. URHD0036]